MNNPHVEVEIAGLGKVSEFRIRPKAPFAACLGGDDLECLGRVKDLLECLGLDYLVLAYREYLGGGLIARQVGRAVLGGFRGVVVVVPEPQARTDDGLYAKSSLAAQLIGIKHELEAIPAPALVAIPARNQLAVCKTCGYDVINDYWVDGDRRSLASASAPGRQAVDLWIDGIERSLRGDEGNLHYGM